MPSRRISTYSRLLRLISHPTRLMILKELTNGIRCVSRIQELLKVRQANVSQHLAVLRENGLVSSHKDGAFRCYYLTKPELVEALFDFLARDYPQVRIARREALRARSSFLGAHAPARKP